MSLELFRSSFLGSPVHRSLFDKNGSTKDLTGTKMPIFQSPFGFLSPGHRRRQKRRVDKLQFGGRQSHFSLRNFDSRNDFKVKCTEEAFPKTKALIRSFVPLWKEGLFIIRCSVFFAVISAAGMLVWYAQLKAKNLVETQLLPSVCSILSEHLQRDIYFGKVRTISPLGITLSSCSVGPHGKEFSCGEVETMKLRIRPFSSLRRGKIVIDAVLFQPCVLVAQKEDFSWLGIPPPSEDHTQRHHSTEDGIDYRTKTRRLAREESASSWARQRVEAAFRAANMGYTVPSGDSASLFSEKPQVDSRLSTNSSRSGLFYCIDGEMHSKDHHCVDSNINYNLKHANLEKSFGTRTGGSGLNHWSKIIWKKFRRKAKQKVLSRGSFSSKQRILQHSATAALAYFRGPDCGKFREPLSSQEAHTSDGGRENSESQVISVEGNSDVTSNDIVHETRSGNIVKLVQFDAKELKSEASLGSVDGILNINESSDALRYGILNNEKDKNHYYSSGSSPSNNSLIMSSEVSPLGMKSRAENHNLSMKRHYISSDSYNSQENIPERDNGGDQGEANFQRVTGMNHKSSWFMPFKLLEILFPFAVNEVLSVRLAGEIGKLKSYLSIKAEDLSAELVGDLNENGSEGIENALPITLDSVYFSGGTLMLLGYGDQEPREMVKVDGHVRFENHYKRIHVQLGGNCMEWRQDHTSQGGGQLSADVFVDIHEQNWHANLNVTNLFAPLFERILEIPVTLPKGRATGEVHICMSKGDSFPSLHGQIDVTGLSMCILDAPAAFSELTASLCFRGQRVFLHNASGWFGDAPVEASGDFGINPEDGEFHLMCQIPCVEVNALMKTLKMKPLLFPLAGSVTAVFNCQGPLDAPIFVGSGIISRKTSQTISSFPPSVASEAVIENKEAGAVAAFDRIPFSHVSANFTFNLDNCVADLYGIRTCLIDGGEIRGAGSAWICPEGEIDETAMDVNLSGTFLLDKVLHRYLGKGVQMAQAKIGELNGETRLSGSLLRPRFDIKWAAPKAEESFGDARGEIIICHDYITINSSSVAFDLYTKVQTSYRDDYRVHKNTGNDSGKIPIIIEGVDLDLRTRGFELTSLISSGFLDSPRTVHLKATGKIKFQGKVVRNRTIIDDSSSECKNNIAGKQIIDDLGGQLVGDVSLSGIKLNQLMLAPQLTGSVTVSRDFMKLSATGRPDENLAMEIVGPLLFNKQEILQNRRLLSISLQKGQLRANIFYEPNNSTNLEVRNFPLDELELASLRGTIQRGELQLNFQKRRGHGMLLVLHPKFSGVLGEALDVAARWSGDVITIEKSVLEQASSKYELQGEYVLPGTRDRYPAGKEKDRLVKQGIAGHLGNVISSMGRWRMRLEVPGAELAEMLPLARLLSRSTDPAVQSRSKDFFIQNLQSAGFYSESLHDQLKAIQNQFVFLDDNILEDIHLPGLAEFRGRWNGSLSASGGGNGDTMADFNFLGEDWEWGNYKNQRVMIDGAYSNRDGLRLEKIFIQKDNATLHADGTILGPITNLHFAVLNFPIGLVPTLVQIIESSTSDSIHSLRQWLTPLKGILHMEGDLRGSLAKPECDVQIRLLDGSIGGIDLGRAEIVASLTPSSRFLFNANFEPIVRSGRVHIQGSIPVTYVQHDLVEETDKQLLIAGSVIQIPVWVKEIERGSQDIGEKKVIRDKNEEGWDFQLAESLKGLNWNLLDEGEVRINADIKDGGMTLITALCPYANWLNGYADILLQVSGTVDQPVLDGSATFQRASVSSPVFRKPLTNVGGTVHVISNRLCITSIESRVSRKGKLLLKGNLPLKSSESSANDKLDLKCEVLEVRAKNIFSGQVDSQIQILGSILQPNISGMIQLSHGEAYLPHDKGNGSGANRLISSHSVFPSADYNRWTATEHASSSFGSLSTSPDNKWPQSAGKQSEAEKKMEEAISKPGVDVRLNDLKLILGPELRIVYPLILNFAVSGKVELDGMAHPKCIRPKGTLTFENGDVNLVATQVRLKRDHLNVAKFEPDFGLDPILDLALMGSEWQFRIQSRASTWQDNLVVTSTRSVDQEVLTPTEAARVFESQLAESLLEGNGQLAFKKLATSTLEKLMPRIEGKGEFGQARWRLVYAPQIPSLLSVDPTIDPLKSLANNISFGTEVEVQLGKRLQASVVRQMKDSEMAMQWTLIYQLTNRLRVLFQSTPSNRLLFEYSAISQN